MPHKFDPRHMAKLEERKKILPPKEVLLELGLKAGEVMIDVGAGAGYFSMPASEIVGDKGWVVALDNSEGMIEELASRVRTSGAGNIEIVLSKEYDLIVADNTADFALLCTVLHEVEDKILFLDAVRKAMKPNGRLAIVEWTKKPMEMGPPLQDRLDGPEALDLLKRLGLHDIRLKDYNEYFYFATAVN
jgi:ubiquinone/menaquinone biosynthesis C-methylase UbiE